MEVVGRERTSLAGRAKLSYQRLAFFFAIIGAGIASACSANAGDEWIQSEQATAEYIDEAKNLELAPGWTWPKDPGYEKSGPDGGEQWYGVNIGRVDAAWYWHCSWGRTYFGAKDDASKQAAFVQMLRLPESAFYKFGLLPDDRRARDEVLQAFQAGDAKMMHSVIDLNCPKGSL